VEFAIRLPGHGEKDAEVLLPIDAKFPQEDYDRLVDAWRAHSNALIEEFRNNPV
jgi:DNA recombination protein RmuC